MDIENGYLLKKDKSFATKAITVGSEPDQWNSMAVIPPITLATTFKQDGPAKFRQFDYGRSGNPSRRCLERCLAALDDAKFGLCFASGLGATTSIVNMLSAGDHILSVDDLYGGTNRYFLQVAVRMKLEITFKDGTDDEDFIAGLQPNTKMVWIESPTNPLLKVLDIHKIVNLVRAYNKEIIVVVDNTFLTAYFQKPLSLGADLVAYSATKYINGHSDVIMGVVTTNNEELNNKLKFLQNACGIVPSPFDCYLVTRSVKTLQLRMDQHMKNGLAVARFLESHPAVSKVLHPGLPSHPQHDVARRMWSGCSGMCSFYLRGGLEESQIFLQSLKIFTLAESLGGFESLAELPSVMTHASVPEEQRKRLGISDNLIRLSVGLESVQDLINDLDQALKIAVKVD